MAITTKAKIAEKYIETIGRRKRAAARVRLTPGKSQIFINERSADEYLPVLVWREHAFELLKHAPSVEKYRLDIHVKGGGVSAQASAIRHGVARALLILDPTTKPVLKKAGAFERDAREKERRKFGLKKARKSPQWSKR
jgi:small subunit ribosomal protein S9